MAFSSIRFSERGRAAAHRGLETHKQRIHPELHSAIASAISALPEAKDRHVKVTAFCQTPDDASAGGSIMIRITLDPEPRKRDSK